MRYFSIVTILLSIIFIGPLAAFTQPQNIIKDADNSKTQLLNWRILGPFTDTAKSLDEIYNFKARPGIKDVQYSQMKYQTVDLGSVFKTKGRAVAYALCTIISDKDQDLGFLINVDDNLRIWINNVAIIPDHKYTSGRRPTLVAHLNKGVNTVLVEVKNRNGNWAFDITAASPEYIKKSALIRDFYLSCKTPLMQVGDSLLLGVSDSNFIPIRKTSRVEIFDDNNKICLSTSIDIGGKEKVPLSKLSAGAYRYKLYTDRDTLTEFFCYGDLDKIYDKEGIAAEYKSDSLGYSVLLPYIKRLDRLLDDFKNEKITRSIDKRIAWCLYKIRELDAGRKSRDAYVVPTTGLMLRTFSSKIDGGNEYYLLYVPEKVLKTKKSIPLAVIVPYVTNYHPFYTGAVIANYDRITYMSKLADKYGIAVLWPSARIFKEYNHTPIIEKAIVETLGDAGKYFNFDKKHIYLYGDCSGGLFALQAAVRRPDLFAAIAVEGPELKDIESDNSATGMGFYNLYALSENLYNLPMYILHSSKDQKAPLALSIRLMDSVRKAGGAVYYDSLDNTLKVENIKEFPESESMYKVFSFFDAQKNVKAKPVKKISTFAFYNDTIYGIRILEKLQPGKASISYLTRGSEIHLTTVNVSKLIIDLDKAGIKQGSKTIIIHNDKKYETGTEGFKNYGKVIELAVGVSSKDQKNPFIGEPTGPINKVFLNKFAVVRPEKASEKLKTLISDLDSVWMAEYQNSIPIINEREASIAKIKGLNLVYLIDDFNHLKKSLVLKSGIELTKQFIVYNGETFSNADISFAFYDKDDSGNDNIYLGVNSARTSP